MKKQLVSLLIANLLIITVSYAQIPNGDFSNWAMDSLGHFDPIGWTSSNSMVNGVVLQDSDHTGGTGHSVKFRILYDSLQGYFVSGNVNLEHEPFTGTVRPTKLSGFWNIYNPHSADQILVEVDLFNAANVQIGGGNFATALSSNFTAWAPFNDTLTYTANDPVANYSILLFYFALSQDTAIYAHFDDLSFDVSTGIDENFYSRPTFTFENTKSGCLIEIEKKKLSNLNIVVIDINGRIVQNVTDGIYSKGKHSEEIDLSTLPAGMYFCRIETEGYSRVFRLSK